MVIRKQRRIKMKKKSLNFPGCLVVKNLPANEGDMGSIPGLGKIPHAVGQLIQHALKPMALQQETPPQ